MLIILFLLIQMYVNSIDIIDLTTKNTIILRGSINQESVSNAINEINKHSNKSNVYLILDTPGGEVYHGMQIINELEYHKINCIVQKAYSMGFAILQACNIRYILPHATVMQHQMSLGLGGEFEKIKNYFSMINQYNMYLTNLQSNRINMNPDDFMNKVNNEWWLFGSNIINENVADRMVYIKCTPSLTNSNYTVSVGNYDYTYSSCPLITKELKKNKNKKGDDFSFIFV